MIVKSFILENDLKKLNDQKSYLFYGVNLGLKKKFKNSYKSLNKNQLLINLNQDEILKNNELILNELSNASLFEEKKIIFIENASDKIYDFFETLVNKIKENKIIIFSENLEKKSKLRSFFEKSKDFVAVPCYEDNELTIKKIILNELKDFKGLSNQNINLILENVGLDRIKLNNELSKIISFFKTKEINAIKLEALLNIKFNEDFNLLKDYAIVGDKLKTNKLLSDTFIENEKNILYLNIINQRMNKLSIVLENSQNSNIETAITQLRPPIFWKDKPIFLLQLKKWSLKKINQVLSKSYLLEKKIKSNNSVNSSILIRNFLLEICNTANV